MAIFTSDPVITQGAGDVAMAHDPSITDVPSLVIGGIIMLSLIAGNWQSMVRRG